MNRRNLQITLIALSVFVFCSYTIIFRLLSFPLTMDEYNYIYQAKIFAGGQLYLRANPALAPLVETYMIMDRGKIFSKYPPGFSLLLTPAVILKIEALVNPLIAAIAIFFLYQLMLSYVKREIALLAVILCASNIYFLGYPCTYFSQPLSMLLLLICVYCVRVFEKRRSRKYLIFLGCCSGFYILVRPLDALCVIVPCILRLLTTNSGKNWKALVPTCVLALFGALVLLVWNYILISKVTIAPYPALSSDFNIIKDARAGLSYNLSALPYTMFDTFSTFIWPNIKDNFVTLFTVPLILAIGGIIVSPLKYFWHYYCIILFFILGYSFHIGTGWPVYGERYFYPLLSLFLIFASRGIASIANIKFNKPLLLIFFTIIVCVQIFQVNLRFAVSEDLISRTVLVSNESKLYCNGKSIVVLNEPFWWEQIRVPYMKFIDLKRNPFLNADQLYVLNEEDYRAIAPFYPEYSRCDYQTHKTHIPVGLKKY